MRESKFPKLPYCEELTKMTNDFFREITRRRNQFVSKLKIRRNIQFELACFEQANVSSKSLFVIEIFCQ